MIFLRAMVGYVEIDGCGKWERNAYRRWKPTCPHAIARAAASSGISMRAPLNCTLEIISGSTKRLDGGTISPDSDKWLVILAKELR